MFGSFFKTFSLGSRTISLASPVRGKVIPLSEVKDQMFSCGLLGDGVAIEPTGTRVVAPAAGKVKAIFPTGHAVALHTDQDLDVLIHVGLDMVKLEGRYFKVHVSVGEHVEAGDVLIEFDAPAIVAAGYDITIPVIVSNSAEFSSVRGNVGADVEELQGLIVVRPR